MTEVGGSASLQSRAATGSSTQEEQSWALSAGCGAVLH